MQFPGLLCWCIFLLIRQELYVPQLPCYFSSNIVQYGVSLCHESLIGSKHPLSLSQESIGMRCLGIFYFAPYVKILRESRKNASQKQHCKHTSPCIIRTFRKKRTSGRTSRPITGRLVQFLKFHIIAHVKSYLNKHI